MKFLKSGHSSTDFRFPSSASPNSNNANLGLQRRSDPLNLKNVVFQHMENQLTVFDRIKQRYAVQDTIMALLFIHITTYNKFHFNHIESFNAIFNRLIT